MLADSDWRVPCQNLWLRVVQDAKVVDHACTALSRIAESYARNPDRLNMLCNHGLITNAVQLVCNSCVNYKLTALTTRTWRMSSTSAWHMHA